MSTKTDLAKEIIDRISPRYSKAEKIFSGRTEITRIRIETDEESAVTGKPKGEYVTVEADSLRPPFDNFDEEAAAIASEIKRLLPKAEKILVIGIGNENLTADSLGPLAVKYLPCGEYFGKKLMAFSPGVYGTGGIEPFLLIKSAVESLAPDGVILMDSLFAENLQHICRSIQLTDAGIAPGSGISPKNSAINSKNLGVPVIGIGTPTVTSAEDSSLLVSPNDIDFSIKRAARLLAVSAALAVFPEMGIELIKELVF